MNTVLKNIYESRPDLSEYLFHFTKGSAAKVTLAKILTDKKIKDINHRGVICFTEAPSLSLVDMFKVFSKYDNPMYAPFGIGIPKKNLYKSGARPVIYGPSNEKLLIDKLIHWRYEDYYPEQKDFSWLREWRIPRKEFQIDNSRDFIIIKEPIDELDNIFNEGEIEVDGCMEDGIFFPKYYQNYQRVWKSIALESIRELPKQINFSVEKDISVQEIGEEVSRFLGSE